METQEPQLGLDLKQKGMARVAENNQEFLERARAIARKVCLEFDDVTSDDVRYRLNLTPLHPNAWGALFAQKEWEFTGDRVRSTWPSNHGREIKVWRWIG